MEWRIIRAGTDDAGRLTEVATAAKRHWGYPESWIEAWRDDLTVTPEMIAIQSVFKAVNGREEVVGFYALRATGAGGELEHFWVLPHAMGRGLGRGLFEHALARARDAGFRELHIDADPHAAGFYEKMGAEPAGAVEAPMDGRPRERPQFVIRLSGT